MSSSEVRIIDHGVGTGYTVTTGEHVVIGHADVFQGQDPSVVQLAMTYLVARRMGAQLSDSALVAKLIEYGNLPPATPDDN